MLVQPNRLVAVLQRQLVLLLLHQRQRTVSVDNRVQLPVKRVRSQSLRISLKRLLVLALLQ